MAGKVVSTPGPLDTNCQIFTGALSSGDRYGVIRVVGKVDYAHKLAWEHVNGPIPEGPTHDGSKRFELHHCCENKACVNAVDGHILLLTSKEHRKLHWNQRRAAKESKQIQREAQLFMDKMYIQVKPFMEAGCLETKIFRRPY